jgi:hypothetical protein
VAIDNRSLDNELATQLTMPLECSLCLQLLTMCDHLVDDELAAQLLMPPECPHPFQYVAMSDHLADDELVAQRTKPWALAYLQINSQSQGQGTSLE